MTPEFYADFLRSNSEGLQKAVIADHGMAIYFPAEIAWKWSYISHPSIFDEWKSQGDEKLAAHLEKIKRFAADGLIPGIELEFMNDGRPVFSPEFKKDIKVLIGSIHFLALPDNPSPQMIIDEWIRNMDMIFSYPVNILGHPFRWLESHIGTVPLEIISETVRRAKSQNIAIEFNSHFKMNSDIPMLKEVIRHKALVTFGSDAHVKSEIGNFSYHFGLLDKAKISINDLTFLSL